MRETIAEELCGSLEQTFGDLGDIAVLPWLQFRFLDPAIERTQSRAAMNLIVQFALFAPAEREPGRMGKIPAKYQRHLFLWRAFELFVRLARAAIMRLGFGPDVVKAASKIFGFDLAFRLRIDFI